MNNQNPLLPQGSALEQKNKGRARVKIAVFFVLAIHGIGLMALLMQGCGQPKEPVAPTETTASNAPPAFVEVTNPPVATSNARRRGQPPRRPSRRPPRRPRLPAPPNTPSSRATPSARSPRTFTSPSKPSPTPILASTRRSSRSDRRFTSPPPRRPGCAPRSPGAAPVESAERERRANLHGEVGR